MSPKRLGWLEAIFMIFFPLSVAAGAITVWLVGLTDPCRGQGSGGAMCGLGVLVMSAAAEVLVALLATVIVVVGYRTQGPGLGRTESWALVTLFGIWLTVLVVPAISEQMGKAESRRNAEIRRELEQQRAQEYDDALGEWWVDRVAEIVGVDLRVDDPPQDTPAEDALATRCVRVSQELRATTLDGSRAITVLDLHNWAGLWTTDCDEVLSLSQKDLVEFAASRGELGQFIVRPDQGLRTVRLVFTNEPATATPLADVSTLAAVADFRRDVDHIFGMRLLCDHSYPIVVHQDDRQPPYQKCPNDPGDAVAIIDLPDVDPPELELAVGDEPLVVPYSPYEITGTSEPGATIGVDDKTVETASDGSWGIWIPLQPGLQTVAIRSTDESGRNAMVQLQVEFDPSLLFLSAEGIGQVAFGAEEENVVSWLSALLGPPTNVTIESAAEYQLPLGYAGRTRASWVEWDHIGFAVVFTDGDYFRNDGRSHLVYWSVRPEALGQLQTPDGLSVDSTLDEIEASRGGE
ncbi:MAG: hypothetical protein GY720_12950, partial [bacterium]|nr:hypothetical protein [bacterium]